eukprot:2408014-Prymnesium_polylepis.1
MSAHGHSRTDNLRPKRSFVAESAAAYDLAAGLTGSLPAGLGAARGRFDPTNRPVSYLYLVIT